MKKSRIFMVPLLAILIVFMCSNYASAEIWEFGTSGGGRNPFTAKGFAIKTEAGKIEWLYSKFDNGGYDENGDIIMSKPDGNETDTIYTGTDNGVQYINAKKENGESYQLYAFTNRNPEVYYYMVAYMKNSQASDFTPITDFTKHLGNPVRTSTNLAEFPNGMPKMWAIPINNFSFQPGTLYEFAFQQGMQARNGITLTLSEKERAGNEPQYYYGYLQHPTGAELDFYNAHKYFEYEFISSYSLVGKDSRNYYSVNFVPMRFSVQTYADMTTWNTAAANVQSFIDGIRQSDYDSGRYNKKSIENLKSMLDTLQNEADTTVKKQLQKDAEVRMKAMVDEINAAMKAAKTSSDMTKLNSKLTEANNFYNREKSNVGNEEGNYSKEKMDELKKVIDSASLLTNQDPQSDIDKAVNDIEKALINVKLSLAQKTKIILTDKLTGITLSADIGVLPDDVSMVVTRIYESDDRYATLKKTLGSNVSDFYTYRILLFEGDKKIQPNGGNVTIQIPVPGSMKDYGISMYYASDDLKPDKISSMRTDDYVLLRSSRVGYFSLVKTGKTKISNTSSNTNNTSKTVDVINQTDILNKDKSDIKESSLDIVSGVAGSEASSITLDGEDIVKEKIENTIIPLDEVSKDSNPAVILMGSVACGFFGIVLGIFEFIKSIGG